MARPTLLVLAAGALWAGALPAQAVKARLPDLKALLWSVETGSPCFGSGAAADLDGDGRVEILFGCYFGDELLRCLSGKSGELLWSKRSIGGPFDASVLVMDLDGDKKAEIVFGDSAHGRMWCLDARGKELWTHAGPSGTDSPPAAADLDGDGAIEVVYGTMKVKGADGRVVVLDGKSGAVRWSAAVPGHIQSEPGLADLDGDGVLDVLVTNWMGDDKLRALNGRNGSELWSFATGDWIYHGVSVHDLDGDGRPEVIVADRKGGVFMLEGEDGKRAWAARLEGESQGTVFGPTTLVDADGRGAPEIAVCGLHLHLLDAQGRLRWRNEYGLASIARGAAAADIDGDGGQDLVFGQGRLLRAVRARDGRAIWTWDLSSSGDAAERIDNGPLLEDLDGDGLLDVFVVIGKGTSGKDRAQNHGRALALKAGKGRASAGNSWVTFRGSPRRIGWRLENGAPRAGK